MQLATLVPLAAKASIVLVVFGIGLEATADDAGSLFRDPPRLARSLVAMMVVVPLFVILLSLAFHLAPAVEIALLALSLAPVPPFWPRKVARAGGGTSYTIGLFAGMAALSIFLVPPALRVVGRVFHVPISLSVGAIAEVALVSVLLPLLAGIWTRMAAPTFAARVATPIRTAGTLLLVAIAIPIVVVTWRSMMTLVGDGTLVAMLAFVVVGLVAGELLGGPGVDDRSTLALASALRHPGMAIAIARLGAPHEPLVPAAVVLYLLVSLVATAPYAAWAKRRTAAAAAARALHHPPAPALPKAS